MWMAFFAIGALAKPMAAIDGLAALVLMLAPLSPGRNGSVTVGAGPKPQVARSVTGAVSNGYVNVSP